MPFAEASTTVLTAPTATVSTSERRSAAPAASTPRADDYASLKRMVAASGLLQRRPGRYLPRVALGVGMLAAVVAGLLLSRGSWWVLAWTLPAALLFGQLGFMAHDATHNQVMTSSKKNYVLSVLLFNLCLGGSRGWWANKHNIHHAQPNRLGTDPDIEGGVIAIVPGQTTMSRGLTRLIMRHQAGVIWPLLSLGILQIQAYSVGFLFNRSRRNARAEAALLALHYAVYVGALVLLLGIGGGLLFALVHQLLLGLYLGSAFLPNHVGMAMLEPDDDMDFLHRQVLTSRNIRASRLTDYVFGGLSCQIEHHLFPAMPRFRLRESAPMVRAFCEERGIEYRETSVVGAYREVYLHLRSVARDLGRRIAEASTQRELALQRQST